MSGTAAPRRVLAPPRASRQERAARTLLWAGAAAGLFLLAENLKGVAAEFPGDLLLAVLIEAVVALAGFGLLRRLRPIHPPPWGPSGASLAWGATAAAGCALPANGGLMAVWSKTGGTGFADEWGAALTAPVNEETLKAAGIVMLALAAPYALRGPVDGMMLGALTGLGFQVTENVIYGANSIIQSGGVEPGLSVVRTSLLRVGVTGPGSHWTMTAVAGAGIGYLVARGVWGARHAVFLFLCAYGMHWFFDAPVLPPGSGTLVKTAVDFLVAAIVYLALRRAYRARARRVLSAQFAAGEAPSSEVKFMLSRRGRRLARRRVPAGPHHDALAAWQQAELDLLDARAADATSLTPRR
ncbi:PrsW family intramembrane metalloprotease [Actinomadura yumaensis]|uniref:PrsW family intramembrane metalloprotease n=1 Tax=Actinomadura yumaensis TaxID=111807 RepID=A0ABW2CW90_9ACTN